MIVRPCVIAGCPNLARNGASRCRVHARRQARGYGAVHERARRAFVARLPLPCAYCGELVRTPLELAAAHRTDGDPGAGWQPAHRVCNERAKVR